MHVRVTDGVAEFATHRITCTLDRQDETVRSALARFQVEDTGIVCYSDAERAAAEEALQAIGVQYTVEVVKHPPAYVSKAQGRKYASRMELIEHLQGAREHPESETMPRLIARLAALERWARAKGFTG